MLRRPPPITSLSDSDDGDTPGAQQPGKGILAKPVASAAKAKAKATGKAKAQKKAKAKAKAKGKGKAKEAAAGSTR